MKIFDQILTSASSGTWLWSDVVDTNHYAKNGYFNLEWNITGDGDGVTFAWSGCSVSTGTFTRSGTTIFYSGSSVNGIASDGRNFTTFSPDLFPFIKIGAWAKGTTTTLSASLIVS
jgi:hypothetical protein